MQVRINSGAKWARRAGSAGQEYAEGVANPRVSWAQATTAAAAAQAAGVQQAITEKRFEKGVARAGDETWKKGAMTKGPGRFAEGVAGAEAAYAAGVAPYTAAIESLKLPPRGPKGDPRNLERVKVVAMKMREVKVRQQ